MSLAYIPKSLINTAGSEPVTDVYLCAYEPNSISPPSEFGVSVNGKMTNHWVMYLVASPTRSICLNPSPTGPGNSIDLIITSETSYTNNAVKSLHLSPSANLTVGHVINHITNSEFDKYTFSAGGQGCRFWLYTVVASLRSAGYITNNSEIKASTEALELVWTVRGDPVSSDQQMGMTKGTFEVETI